jgi:hypothetical protein
MRGAVRQHMIYLSAIKEHTFNKSNHSRTSGYGVRLTKNSESFVNITLYLLSSEKFRE